MNPIERESEMGTTKTKWFVHTEIVVFAGGWYAQ